MLPIIIIILGLGILILIGFNLWLKSDKCFHKWDKYQKVVITNKSKDIIGYDYHMRCNKCNIIKIIKG